MDQEIRGKGNNRNAKHTRRWWQWRWRIHKMRDVGRLTAALDKVGIAFRFLQDR